MACVTGLAANVELAGRAQEDIPVGPLARTEDRECLAGETPDFRGRQLSLSLSARVLELRQDLIDGPQLLVGQFQPFDDVGRVMAAAPSHWKVTWVRRSICFWVRLSRIHWIESSSMCRALP